MMKEVWITSSSVSQTYTGLLRRATYLFYRGEIRTLRQLFFE